MTQDKWDEVKFMVKKNFKIISEGKEELTDPNGFVEYLIFETPKDIVRLERVRRQKVLDKKNFYSRRSGGATKVEYVYSENEMVDMMQAYRKNDEGGWEEMKSSWTF